MATTVPDAPVTARLALLGTLLAVFGEIHPAMDQWAQSSRDARCKGLYGDRLVHTDGKPVTADTARDRAGEPTLTASQLGRRCAARHVAAYSAGQLTAAVAVTRALGYRVPARALLAGAAINAITHAVIDRREPLLRLAKMARKDGYANHCQAVRMDDDGNLTRELSGPGTGLLELDQAAHRAVGVLAAAVTTWCALRGARKTT
ncbi:hypothetical protein [Streptomyces sp. MN6]